MTEELTVSTDLFDLHLLPHILKFEILPKELNFTTLETKMTAETSSYS